MKKGQLKRGYSPLNKLMENKGKYIADCNSCIYWSSPDKEQRLPEQCHNKGVTKFDMVEREDGRIFCTYWRGAGMSRRDEF